MVAARFASAAKNSRSESEKCERRRRRWCRDGWDEARNEDADQAERDDRGRAPDGEPDDPGDRARDCEAAKSREGQHRRADGQRCRAGERDHAVLTNEDTGRDKPVDREKSGHHGEASADDDGSAIARSDARSRESNRGDSCAESGNTDAVEVDPQRRHHHVRPTDQSRSTGTRAHAAINARTELSLRRMSISTGIGCKKHN